MADLIHVTDVLQPHSMLHDIDPEIIKRAGERGDKVHKAIANILGGYEVFNYEDSEIDNYIQSFKQWDRTGKIVAVELRLDCHELGITGAIDTILQNDKGYAIVDYKTSAKESKTWSLQGSAYRYLARLAGYDINQIIFVQLKKDGSQPSVYHYEDELDMFLRCLELYKYFSNKGEKNVRKRRKSNVS